MAKKKEIATMDSFPVWIAQMAEQNAQKAIQTAKTKNTQRKRNPILPTLSSGSKNAYQALYDQSAQQGQKTMKLSFDDSPYRVIPKNVGKSDSIGKSPIIVSLLTDRQKREGIDFIKKQYQDHPFRTGLKDDLISNNTIVPKPLRMEMGNSYALKMLDADGNDMKQIEKSQDGFAYKAGNFAGEATQYMIPYTGFSKAFKAGTVGGKAVLKATPKVSAALRKVFTKVNPATLDKVAEALVRNAAMDLTIGTTMDTYKGHDNGLKGRDLAEYVAKNAVLNLGLGGVLDAAPYAFRGAKNAINAPRIPVVNPVAGEAVMVRNSILEAVNGITNDGLMRIKVNGPASIGRVNNTTEALTAASKTMKMRLEDFTDPTSPIWNNIDYDNEVAKSMITAKVHSDMIANGDVLKIEDKALAAFQDYFPDLRNMKKQERLPIQKQKIKELKTLLRTMLETDFKNKPIDFQVNGNILEAKLGGVGINEVLEKITQQKAVIIGRTDEIFSRAKYLYSTLDKTGDPNIYRWNHFYVPVKVGDDIFGVRIAIRDMKINQSQIYHYGIKKGTTSPTG